MRRISITLLLVVAVLAVLAPFLCNDVPLVARVDGALRFPVLASIVGDAGLAPDGSTWKHWWASRGEGDADFAVMPPWAIGPFEVHAHSVLTGPSAAHPLGVDDAGRDQLTRLLHGARTALFVGLGSVALALLIGVTVGGIAGLARGLVDAVSLRVMELFQSFPALVAALAGAALFGGSLLTVIVLLALVQWTHVARIVRGELLSLRERPFVEAARGLGVSKPRLLLSHLLPQLRGPVLVTAAFLAADAIQIESTLSFLGLGAGPETVSWGAMLDAGRTQAFAGAWHAWLFPALAIALTVLGLHAVAERVAEVAPRKSS